MSDTINHAYKLQQAVVTHLVHVLKVPKQIAAAVVGKHPSQVSRLLISPAKAEEEMSTIWN